MKLGIVGSGKIVDEVLSFIQGIEGYELIHISGTKRSEEKLQVIKDQYGMKRYSTEYQDLLDDQEVDVIYIALPNHLHYDYAKRALEANKHVILEKPFTVNVEETRDLIRIAIENNLFLFEAITNQYFKQLDDIKKILPQLGDIKLATFNFSQYSSRYNAFLNGDILPAFDYRCAGGALMDLNIYNIHFAVSLFGRPRHVNYYPNIQNGIDTSGVLILDYDGMTCTCIGAKDTLAPLNNIIQGNQGFMSIKTPVSILDDITVVMNSGERVKIENNQDEHRMVAEFRAFLKMYQEEDYLACAKRLKHTEIVMDIQTQARYKAELYLADERNED